MGKKTSRAATLAKRGLAATDLRNRVYKRARKKLAPATTINYDRSKAMFTEFCDYLGINVPLSDGSAVPQASILKQFLAWWVGSSKGRIGEVVSLDSTESTWERLQALIYRETGNKVDAKVNEDVLAYVRSDLREEFKIAQQKRTKYACDAVIYRHLMTQIFCDDSDEFEWERTRIQTILVTQILFFSAGRIGAFVPTTYYPDLSLTYGDIEIVLLRDENNVERFGVVLTQNWMKGEKDNESQSLTLLWLEEDELMNCIVSTFLSVVFADQALQDFKSIDELRAQKLEPSEEIRVFHIKPAMLTEPFLINKDGSAWKYHAYIYALERLSYRCGYLEWIHPYDIRRGSANSLDESTSTSMRQTNQILGQKDNAVYQKHYQSNISKVDIKGIVLRGKPDAGFSSSALRRNPRSKRLPHRLPSRAHQEYLKTWRELVWSHQDEGKDVLGKRARKQAWFELRKIWSGSQSNASAPKPDGEIPTLGGSTLNSSIEMLGDLNLPETRSLIMKHYDTNRAHMSDEASKEQYSLRSSKAIHSMIMLSNRDYVHPAEYYVGELPLQDLKCPRCPKILSKKSITHRQQHLRACAFKAHFISGPVSFAPKYCHRCSVWSNNIDDLRKHRKKHFQTLDMFCGILRLRNVIVSGGRCPFCLAKSEFQAWGEYEKVVTEFTVSFEFLRHLRDHLVELFSSQVKNVKCPHPRCSNGSDFSRTDLLHHFYDDHGITEDLFGTQSFSNLPPSQWSAGDGFGWFYDAYGSL